MYLLDVNVLIALVGTNHVQHETVADWFWKHHVDGWATCPITERMVLFGFWGMNYPNGPQSAEAARWLRFALNRGINSGRMPFRCEHWLTIRNCQRPNTSRIIIY